MTAKQHSDLSVIVGGVVALLIGGMIAIAIVSATVTDSAATVAAIVSMMTVGSAGIFGLAKMQVGVVKTAEALAETMAKTVDEQAAALQENTDLTKKVVRSVNGDLDARMKRISKEAMTEILEEWTRPRPPA